MDELKHIVWEMDVTKWLGEMNKNKSLDCILYRMQRIPQYWENLYFIQNIFPLHLPLHYSYHIHNLTTCPVVTMTHSASPQVSPA